MESFWKYVVSEGVAGFDDEYAIKILNQPMPDSLAIKVGAKKVLHMPNIGKVKELVYNYKYNKELKKAWRRKWLVRNCRY